MTSNRRLSSPSLRVISAAPYWVGVALTFLLCYPATSAWGQQPCLRWFQVASAGSPGPRFGHAMAYDSHRGVTVLFGGATTLDGLFTDNQTWEYDGIAWKIIPITGAIPSPRYAHDLAYDAVRREVVLFGGVTGGEHQNDETWTYQSDGTVGTWTRRYPTTVPIGREVHPSRDAAPGFFLHKMVFDATRGVIVLHGGTYLLTSQDDETYLVSTGRTWEWNGINSWALVFDPISINDYIYFRSGHAMAFDSVRGRTVLFGGSHFDELQEGTLEYTGTWTQVPGSTPALRSGHTMAYDSRRNKVVMFGGGGTGAGLGDDTDEYTGGVGWTSLLDSGPPPRQSHGMVYDRRRGVMVVYGGYPPSGQGAYADTWELDVCTRPPESVRWVDFAYTGQQELGTFAAPFNTLAEGVTSIPAGGTLRIKAGRSGETLTISKPMTISAYGGPVMIGR